MASPFSPPDSPLREARRYTPGLPQTRRLPHLLLGTWMVGFVTTSNWDSADRKGNVLRNWVVEYLSTKPLQSQQAITEALKLAGIDGLWDQIEPNRTNRKALVEKLNHIIHRRNQISHEGDREQSRNSGKALRTISKTEVSEWIDFIKNLVDKIETAFPR